MAATTCNDPNDFPIESSKASVAGAHPKLALVERNGRFEDAGEAQTGAALESQGQVCDVLAGRMADFCRTYGKVNAVGAKAALLFGLDLLRSKRWCSDVWNVWVMRRVAHRLNWPPLRVETGTATWFECEQLPYWMDPVGPPRQRVLSRVEQIRASYNAGRHDIT